MTPKEVLALCREKDVKAVDLRFCDLFGKWQHTHQQRAIQITLMIGDKDAVRNLIGEVSFGGKRGKSEPTGQTGQRMDDLP